MLDYGGIDIDEHISLLLVLVVKCLLWSSFSHIFFKTLLLICFTGKLKPCSQMLDYGGIDSDEH